MPSAKQARRNNIALANTARFSRSATAESEEGSKDLTAASTAYHSKESVGLRKALGVVGSAKSSAMPPAEEVDSPLPHASRMICLASPHATLTCCA